MATNATDAIVPDLLSRLSKIMQDFHNTLDRKARLNLMKHELSLSAQRDIERMELLAQLTNNGEKLPLICVYQKEDTKLCDYIENKINEYNKSDIGLENPILYERMNDNVGRSVLLTNEDGLEKFKEFRMQYAVEKGGYVSEIPLPDFEKAAKYNNTTIINGVTEDQFNYIQEKAWGSKNNFSYAAKMQENGTYSIAILSKNYIGNTKRETKDDLFSALVSEKVANNDSLTKEARKYDKELEKKIVTYNEENPIYIASARNKGIFLKVETDKITVMGLEDEPIEISKKNKDGELTDQDFMVDSYKYLSKIDEPTIIDTKDKRVQMLMEEKGYKEIENLLDDHSRSADDNDLIFTDETGKKKSLRPLKNITLEIKNNEHFAKLYALELGTRATKEMTKYYTEEYSKDFKDALSEASNPGDIDEKVTDFKKRFAEKFEAMNGPSLSESKRRNIVLEIVDDMTDAYSPDDKMKIEDAFVETYNDIPVDMSHEEKQKILKNKNEELSKSIMIKDTTGMSKELVKIISAADVPLSNLLLNETKAAVEEVTDMDTSVLYLTPDNDLSTKLNYDIENESFIDKKIEAKAEVESNEQMGIDTQRTYKDKETDTKTERKEERER